MDKKIKALFFDIDGTLVSFRTHKIPQSTVMRWRMLNEMGWLSTSLRDVLLCLLIT